MKDDTRNYVIVGSFVIAALVALLLWLAVLAGRTGSTDPYEIHYANVMGLQEGTQILYEGYPVGLIESIERVREGDDKYFRIDVSVQRGWKIPDDSVANITAGGLLSAVVIDIEEGDSATLLSPGSLIPSQEAANVFAAISAAADTLGDLVENSVKPLMDSIGEGAPTILDNLEVFTTDLNTAVGQINELLSTNNTGRIRRILENLESTSEEVAGLTDGLTETRAQLDSVLGTLDRLVTENETEIGHTLVDLHHSLEAVARHIDAISSNMEVTTRNLNEFSLQVRQNPGVILRGRDAGDGEAN